MRYLVLYLLLAHVVGDFYLQNNAFCKNKRGEKWYGWRIMVHSAVIFVLSWVATFSWSGWLLAACVALSHWGIDLLKAVVERRCDNDKRYYFPIFVTDQLLHLAVIVSVSYFWVQLHTIPVLDCLKTEIGMQTFLFVFFALIAHTPANIFVTLLLQFCHVPIQNAADMQNHLSEVAEHGSFRSGALIGTLERLLMMAFVVLGQYEAVGFLIAAKSILRFSETTKGSEKAEYVLSGTLISVAIALLFGLLTVHANWLI